MYAEYAPHPSLARYVACYWSSRARPAGPALQAVLPDGCIDILFDLSGHKTLAGAAGNPFVVGTMTRPVTVDQRGVDDLFGIRFRPGGATAWLDASAASLRDRTVGLDSFWGGAAERFCGRLAEETDLRRRMALADIVLDRRLRAARRPADEQVMVAAELLTSPRSGIAVADVAEAVGLGRRQLERRFLDAVGASPKTLARIMRFQGVVAGLWRRDPVPLAHLALQCGYADQAHLTREFREFAGVTPSAYRLGERLPIAPAGVIA